MQCADLVSLDNQSLRSGAGNAYLLVHVRSTSPTPALPRALQNLTNWERTTSDALCKRKNRDCSSKWPSSRGRVVDGSAPGDSLAALKLADLQLQTHGRRALRPERPSDTDVLTSSGRDLDTGARTYMYIHVRASSYYMFMFVFICLYHISLRLHRASDAASRSPHFRSPQNAQPSPTLGCAMLISACYPLLLRR